MSMLNMHILCLNLNIFFILVILISFIYLYWFLLSNISNYHCVLTHGLMGDDEYDWCDLRSRIIGSEIENINRSESRY
jgi:hypothetical protein